MTQAKKVKYMAAAMLIVASRLRAERGTGVYKRSCGRTATWSPSFRNPTISLADEVATTKRIIDAQTAAAT